MNRLEKAGLKIAKLLQKEKFQAFWVGGVVRNNLLKRPSDNIDIATEATPGEVEKILDKAGIKNKPVGREFGSTLAILGGFKIEITTFRSESRYSDHRHPDKVEFVKDYVADARRRDFTVNALYFDPIKKQTFDPVTGKKDLKARSLRFIGDPKKRIGEDALRMLRGVRLATELGFKLNQKSLAAIQAQAKLIQAISGERVKAELDKILLSDSRAQGLRLLQSSGLLAFIIPEFLKLKKVFHNSKLYHLEGDTTTHTFKAVEILRVNDLALTYATLFHDTGKVITPRRVFKKDEWKLSYRGHVKKSGEIFEKFANQFKFPKEQRNLVSFLVGQHDQRRWFVGLSPEKQVEFMLGQTRPELLVELWRVDSGANKRIQNGRVVWGASPSVPVARKVLTKIGLARNKFSLADGNIIMKLGNLKPGKELGQKILEIKVKIVLGEIKNTRDLKKFLLKNPKNA